MGNPIDKVGVTPQIVTSEGKELTQAHSDFLTRIYETYRKLVSLNRVEEENSFLVEFNSPVDWTSITHESFNLIELGGESYPFQYESISEKKLVITSKQKLKKGYHVPLNVE